MAARVARLEAEVQSRERPEFAEELGKAGLGGGLAGRNVVMVRICDRLVVLDSDDQCAVR